jgi:hypothetical protein
MGASRSIRSGDHNKTNRMFRMRIYAQAFTLIAMVAGSVYWNKDRQKRKEFESGVAERKAKKKNEAWIRELEARDREDSNDRAARRAWAAQADKQAAEQQQSEASQMAAKDKILGADGKKAVEAARLGPRASSMVSENEQRRTTLEAVVDLLYRGR